MLRGARIEAEWMNAPTAADVRQRDQERLIEALLAPVEHEADDLELAQRLMAERSPEDIAASLVRAHRAAMPPPEDLIDNGPPRSEEHTSELQSLMRISYAVFCLKKQNNK